jgi:hypothetical protein
MGIKRGVGVICLIYETETRRCLVLSSPGLGRRARTYIVEALGIGGRIILLEKSGHGGVLDMLGDVGLSHDDKEGDEDGCQE